MWKGKAMTSACLPISRTLAWLTRAYTRDFTRRPISIRGCSKSQRSGAPELVPLNPAFPTVRIDGGDSFSDFMLGARYTWAMSERWGLTLRGDGSFGDTEGTWNASAILQYKMKRGAWLVGYRYLDAEVKTGGTNTNIAMSGPMFGYGFKF